MWDGVSATVARDVDIVVRGQRIAAVEPHREGRPGTLIDASDKFVMPSMIDIHHHREMQGYAYGSRQGPLWLALGITTTRSPGSPAYHMVEERESVQSGARLAPRYLGTGQAVDGPRIYYNFMRPTFSHDQLRLELERAANLATSPAPSTRRTPRSSPTNGSVGSTRTGGWRSYRSRSPPRRPPTRRRHHTVEQLLAPYPSSTTTDQAAPGAPAPRGKVKARVPAHPSTAGFWWNNPAELERARVSCDHDH
ncbi:hypothetical protein [Microtetraspora sp. NBRC 16547]|uniref:hypothetical protein n=1 Tax=Microtetraspora sp. NBRC 16547 TaxID=3030993 RepID=UPI0024A1B510|nr:hypothetical protein [Microtetraspora sp. NBRC 16547]GLW98507.1 hypothetical protein Misp02_25940 [Microtetraspora sp. NBRC 16547]